MLQLDVVPSRIRLGLLLWCHLSAIAGICMSALSLTQASPLLALVLLSLGRVLAAGSHGAEPRRIQLARGSSRLQFAARVMFVDAPEVRFVGEFLIHLYFPPLEANAGQRGYSLLLFPDSLSMKQNWQLRRYLCVGSDRHASR